MKKHRKKITMKRFSANFAGIFLVICIAIGVLYYQYSKELSRTIQDESKGYLQEVTNRISSNIDGIVNNNYAVLDAVYTYMSSTKVTSINEIQNLVATEKKHWGFESLLLIDEDGIASSSDGSIVSLSSDVYLRDTIVNNKNTMSPAQLINNKEYIVFAIPIKGVALDGKNIDALAVTYEPQTFDQVLEMKSFNEEAFSQVIDKNGLMVIRSSSNEGSNLGYNVFQTIRSSVEMSEEDYKTMRQDIDTNHNGQYSLTLQDRKVYMVYTPIGINDWYLLTFVPTETVNAKSNVFMNITAIFGIFVTSMFAILTLYLTITFYRNKRNLEHIAYVDVITGGHTIQRFYEIAREIVSKKETTSAMIYLNVEKFKILNEELGRENGDKVIRSIQKGIEKTLLEDECMGHMTADNFCVLVSYKDKEEILARLNDWYTKIREECTISLTTWKPISIEFGVYVIEDNEMEFPFMIDRAKLALKESLTESSVLNKVHYAFYDEKARIRMLREKELEDMMEDALHDGDFQVYLQPKFNVNTKEIGGAEALTRWISKKEGLIYPNDFIPVFEKNGFIVTLDLWVFEQVCQLLERWQSEGKKLITISINCSRAHLKNPQFVEHYKTIFDKYNIPAKYIEIELTESMAYEDIDQLKYVIEQIHKLGFACSMDDFGSGYSSLNLIQELPFDSLKIDRIFFTHDPKHDTQTEAIVGSIIMMAKALSMQTVAEGVEVLNQVDMLKRIQCDLIQGFVFAKPLPLQEFEELAFPK